MIMDGTMHIEEIFTSRVIPFPAKLWRNEHGNPDVERFLLGITAAAMLFPREYENFAGYVASELRSKICLDENRLLTLYEQLNSNYTGLPEDDIRVLLQDAMRGIPDIDSLLNLKETQTDLTHVLLQRYFFGSPASFLKCMEWRGFSKNGKGSLAERMMQGRICGLICFIMAKSKEKKLREAVETAIPILEEWRKESDDINEIMPTLSFGNIHNTIWSRFKNVAWLWSAFCFESPEHDGQNLMLEETRFYRSPLTEDLGVYRGGWWGAIDYGLKVYDLLYNKKDTAKDENEDNLPWRLSFQLGKKN